MLDEWICMSCAAAQLLHIFHYIYIWAAARALHSFARYVPAVTVGRSRTHVLRTPRRLPLESLCDQGDTLAVRVVA